MFGPLRKMFFGLFQSQQPSDRKIVEDYGIFVQRDAPLPTRIEDASVLPHAKNVIMDAIFREMARAKNDDIREFLKIGAIFLAQFQQGVGHEPLEMLGMDISKLPSTQDPQKLRREIAMVLASQEKTAKRFEAFNQIVQAEIALIEAKITGLVSQQAKPK